MGVCFYVTSCIRLTYLYCSEMAPLAVRTQITCMSTASSWIFNFLVVEITLWVQFAGMEVFYYLCCY
ncbi:hypothetical protein BDV34DRAFT_186348 [Aspergillus parasiticus]|uniref:Uncharacterized protein n=2 Tax=Aspergillus subgen. Circumdati TaxID=2720871 RepID=A0A5N6DZR0_ASPPA|nr:hypothetical protein BDV34DRAFT_186348 [Aspergillus parasiticus]KAE8317931.1 hypothetical protein BDV41DRAFT_524115 [Aspergillus transmontanensis]